LLQIVDLTNLANALEHTYTTLQKQIQPEVIIVQYETFLLEFVQVEKFVQIDG
jgi:hypothetical protein